jgi:hypothetical protein
VANSCEHVKNLQVSEMAEYFRLAVQLLLVSHEGISSMELVINRSALNNRNAYIKIHLNE